MSEAYLWRQGQCNETAGFLFSHPCGEMSEHLCVDCQKPVCVKHVVDTQGMLRCTTCAKKWFRTSGRAGATGQTGVYDPYYGSPYFYAWHFYGTDRHHHHHHFQDADEGALHGSEPGREGLEGFEQDMGAS